MTKEALRRNLARATVGIAGAGGLGSNCAAALARSGVGALVIADFDTVTEANLDRQFYFRSQVGIPKVEALSRNLSEIDPSIKVSPHKTRLDPESAALLFSECDVIVEAFDDPSAKAMIVETILRELPETPVVSASGLGGFGHFDDISVQHCGNLYLCGDRKREVSPDNPPLAPRVGIVANLEADLVLEILCEKFPQALYSSTLD